MMDILFFEPHDDDMIIGAGGSVLQLIDAGWDIKSVLMTDGRHGSDEISPEELVEIRREEKEEEVDFLGIECEFLELEDGKLADLDEERTPGIVRNLAALIESDDPEYVLLPAPSEGHPDHRATREMVEKALKEADTEPVLIYYIVWETPFLDSEYMDLEKEIAVEIDDEFGEKVEGIEIHESQTDRRKYTEMVRHFNAYCARLYSGHGTDQVEYVEMLGVREGDASGLLEDLRFSDVSDFGHGREPEDISLGNRE